MLVALALALLFASLADPAWGFAPPQPPLPQGLSPGEVHALEEISLLRDATRRDVLRVARYPAGLLRLEGLAHSFAVSEEKLEAVVAGYPPESRDAFRAVFADPELLEHLLENLKLVVALGAAWRLDPRRTEAALAEYGRQIERERAEAAARAQQERAAAAAREAQEQAQREARRWRYDPWGYGPDLAWGYGSGWYGSPWSWGCW